MNCAVSLHLWSMKPTQAWEKQTLITHIPPFFVMCSNSYTRIFGEMLTFICFHDFLGHRWDMIWYLQNPTGIYLEWRFLRLGILHKHCPCTTLQPHTIGGLWVEQQQWCFLLSTMTKHSVLPKIHAPVKDRYWSKHPTSLSNLNDHCMGIQLVRTLTYSLYLGHLPSLSAARRLEHTFNSQCRTHIVNGPWWWMQFALRKHYLLC